MYHLTPHSLAAMPLMIDCVPLNQGRPSRHAEVGVLHTAGHDSQLWGASFVGQQSQHLYGTVNNRVVYNMVKEGSILTSVNMSSSQVDGWVGSLVDG